MKTVSLLLLLACSTIGSACDKHGNLRVPREFASPTPLPRTPVLIVSPKLLTLDLGQSQQVVAKLDGEPVQAAWASDKPEVASVSTNGTISCLLGGLAVVEASLGPDAKPIPDSVHVTCRDELAVTVTPGLAFDHKIGHSPCPQSAGQIAIKMVTGTAGIVTIESLDPALEVGQRTFTLYRGEEGTVEVFFNCGRQTSFTGQVRVTVEDERTKTTYLVNVNGSVHL